MHKLQELKIWKKAIELATDVYEVTNSFPKEEKYGLISQIRRSVVSISSNIAEGAGRNSKKEFCYFLGISNGSCYELQTQIIISQQLKLIDEETAKSILKSIDEIQKMNYRFQKSIQQGS
jgi:four helix bundle protein